MTAGSLWDRNLRPQVAGGVNWRLWFPGQGQVEYAATEAAQAAWLPPPQLHSKVSFLLVDCLGYFVIVVEVHMKSVNFV